MDPSTNALAQIMQVMDLHNQHRQLSVSLDALPRTAPMTIDPVPTTSLGNLMFTPEQMNNLALMLSMQTMQQPLSLPLFNPLATYGIPSLPLGLASLPPHATLESLGLIAGSPMIRPLSQSALSSPQPSTASDIRPRAFSSAATLQHMKSRKRSHNVFENKKHEYPFLCGLIEKNDEPPAQIFVPPSLTEEERVRDEVTKVLARSKPPQRRAAQAEDINSMKLTPLVPESDLPETPDKASPFRHHFKYTKRKTPSDPTIEMVSMMEDITSFCVATGVWVPKTEDSCENSMTPFSDGSPKASEEEYACASPKKTKTLSELLDQTLAMELVAVE